MAVFRFRLQPILEQREEAREEAAKQLAQKQKELQAAKDTLAELEGKEKGLTQKREDLRKEMATADKVLSAEQIRQKLVYIRAVTQDRETARDNVLAQKMEAADCEDRLRDAQKSLIDAQRAVEILRKYRDRLKARFDREAEQKEALEQDEIGNMLFMSRRERS